jgi:hypothetical protein
MLRFESSRAQLSKDLLELKMRTGGVPGVLSVAGTVVPVVKLRENLFATDQKISPTVKVATAMAAVDVHQVGSSSDFHYFLQRYKRFDKEDHGSSTQP